MKKQSGRYLAAMLATALTSGQVAAADCMNEQVLEADQVRFLQSALMVAALQCKRVPGFRAAYNDFVNNNRVQLKASYHKLEMWLDGTGEQDVGKHLTSQANRISATSWKSPNFCEGLFEIAAKATGSFDLLPLVADMPVSYEPASYGTSCATRTLTAQKQ